MPRYQINRLQPIHLRMVHLKWLGYDNAEIVQRTGLSPSTVSHVLNSPEAKAIFDELANNTLDTTAEVASEIQALAPQAIRRLGDLVVSGDDRVAFMAARELAHMAGHAPVKRMAIAQATVIDKKYENLAPHELRQKLLEDLSNDDDPSRVLN